MHAKVNEVLRRAYGEKYGGGDAAVVKVSSEAVEKLRHLARSLGDGYVAALEEALRKNEVQVSLSDWAVREAEKLKDGMVYVSEAGEYQVDWLSDSLDTGDPVEPNEGADDSGYDWLLSDIASKGLDNDNPASGEDWLAADSEESAGRRVALKPVNLSDADDGGDWLSKEL